MCQCVDWWLIAGATQGSAFLTTFSPFLFKEQRQRNVNSVHYAMIQLPGKSYSKPLARLLANKIPYCATSSLVHSSRRGGDNCRGQSFLLLHHQNRLAWTPCLFVHGADCNYSVSDLVLIGCECVPPFHPMFVGVSIRCGPNVQTGSICSRFTHQLLRQRRNCSTALVLPAPTCVRTGSEEDVESLNAGAHCIHVLLRVSERENHHTSTKKVGVGRLCNCNDSK